uniref:Resolvase/invertase-type recombinase catalytic domain-containing protein n=1 Tax=Heterorhabditis bacteriophora TaxID=37862 RepID=A0A1I7WBM8_HETBA
MQYLLFSSAVIGSGKSKTGVPNWMTALRKWQIGDYIHLSLWHRNLDNIVKELRTVEN